MVIPSLHKRLAGNVYYSYDDLYGLVAAFKPDLVGVEIRAEDMGRPDAYLHHNYPEEMIVLARKYGRQAFGFDWLGSELAARAIPEDWWTRQSPIKQLERAWDAHPPRLTPDKATLNARMEALSAQQDQLSGRASAAALADGRYDRITAAYYSTMAELLRGTPYATLPAWYAERDRQIAASIVRAVVANPGRRIAVVTGCDHHGPVVAALSALGDGVVVVPVP
jgi:hypothetical protein